MTHHIAFYKFAFVADVDAVVTRLREVTAPLLGSILVASEGINGMLAGSAEQLDEFEQGLQVDPAFHGKFAGTVFKRTECLTPPFKRMKVHGKKEIVPLGIDGVDAAGRTADIERTNVAPQAWRALIKQPDVVLLDNRNSFEHRLGKFDGAIDDRVSIRIQRNGQAIVSKGGGNLDALFGCIGCGQGSGNIGKGDWRGCHITHGL